MLKAYSIATAAASIAAGDVTDNRQSAIMTPRRHRQTEWQTESSECIISTVCYVHLAELKICHAVPTNCEQCKAVERCHYLCAYKPSGRKNEIWSLEVDAGVDVDHATAVAPWRLAVRGIPLVRQLHRDIYWLIGRRTWLHKSTTMLHTMSTTVKSTDIYENSPAIVCPANCSCFAGVSLRPWRPTG